MKAHTPRKAKAKPAPASADRGSKAQHETARTEMLKMINGSGPFRRLHEELEHYPMELFRQICTLYSLRKAPVPDYAVLLVPYLGEISLRALEECGLVEMSSRDMYAIRAFTPTSKGHEIWSRMGAE